MAEGKSGSFSLVRLSLAAIAIFVVCALAVVFALVGVQSSSKEAITAWRSFADQASPEQRVFRNYVTMAGMAGFMDDYAKLAATGRESRLIYALAGGAMVSINSYPVVDASEAEKQAQATLQANLRAHLERIGPVLAMHRAGRPPAEIAKIAWTDDAAVADALRTLSIAVKASGISDASQLEPKGLTLLDVRQALGLGGLVQHGNAYLATGDAEHLARAKASTEEVRQALIRYRMHSLAPKEEAAVEAFEKTLETMKARLTAGSPGPLDTTALQASLFNLESLVFGEATTAQNNLQTTLGEISDQAGKIVTVVGVGAILLLQGSVWLLVFRIGSRIKALTQTMRNLAAGKLDEDIPAASDRDEIGEMSRALLVFRDGLRANASLTQELAESSRLASLGAMVAGMAHELNTPLGNALAVSSTLEEQCKGLRKDLTSERILRSVLERHAAALEEAATLIQRNLVRASDQIGSFKQVAVDQTSGRRREFHLDDVLANVVQSLQPMFKRTPFTLTIGEPSGAVMESYPGALSQVLTNLVENGLKHGLAGQASGKVEVSVRRLGPNFTEIIVLDDGVGIPADIKPRIFNAFFTTKEGKGGSGLGLHIVKSIVSGPMGGQISVISEPGKGSRFILTLPNKAPAETAGAEPRERTYYAAA